MRKLTLALAVIMLFSLLSGCKPQTAEKAANDTLVIGSTEFNGIFNPAFYRSAYDGEVAGFVFNQIYTVDEQNNLIGDACEYKAPEEFEKDGKKYTKYTFKIKPNVNFSDGEPIKAEDIIFTYKVYLDPSYDGLGTMFKVPILGVDAFRYDTPNFEAKKAEFQAAADNISDDYVKQYIRISYAEDFVNAETVEGAMAAYGFENPEALEGDALKEALLNYIVEIEFTDYYNDFVGDAQGWLPNFLLGEFVKGKTAGGTVEVPDIEGVKKIDTRTVEVTIEGVTATAERDLGQQAILPEHYYGKDYVKGNLIPMKQLNEKPMGGGPYKFISYSNNIVTLTANESYFMGKPKIPFVVFQKVDDANKIDELNLGNNDISEIPATTANVQKLDELSLEHRTMLNNGYGYIGINADRVTNKDVRKGLMHLMNRAPAVEAYYGDLAEIIERPMSKVMWAYPESATEYYGYDVSKAVEYFGKGGFTKDGSGKLVDGSGKQFSIQLWLSSATHPVVPLFNQMKIDLESMGAVCEIMSVDWSVYNEKYQNGEVDVWAAAWGDGADPDMYQIYHSNQIATGNNPYHIRSAELDQLILDGLATTDKAKRTEIYGKALDIVMDEAVEMPFYQRMLMYGFNGGIIKADTLPKNLTPFHKAFSEVHTLELY